MIKAVIFDCFGVVFFDDFEKAYKHFGGDVVNDAEFIEQFLFDVSKGKQSWYEGIKERFGVSKQEWNEVNKEINSFNLELLNYIKELRQNYKVALLSNVGSDGLASYMDYQVLEDHFDAICESAKIGFAKPEARAYEVAADMLGVRLDECVFTDDRMPYIEGAQHVGMKTILFKNTDQFKKEMELLLND